MKYLISIKRLLPNGTLCFLRGLAISLLISLPALAQTASATVTYFHNDISGSPMLATDAAGNQVWKESYRPYGQKLRDEPASRDGKNKIGFAGSPFDASTGLSYMGARYYDPVIGRFMGVDPVGFQENNVHSFNRYAYANNNPYKFVDRNGKYAELAIEGYSLYVGFSSLISNIQSRNYGAAAVDAGGVFADAIGAAIPGAPGFVGLGIKASREAAELGVKGAGNVAKTASGKRIGDFTPRDKRIAKENNAIENGGVMACNDCARPLENIANTKGVPTPHNQAQVHHDPAIKDGGGRHSEAVVVCPSCHQNRHAAERNGQ